MKDSLPIMASKVLKSEENEYINNVLKACSEDLTIKSYTVIRESSWEEMKKQVDAIVEHNPMLELASSPLNFSFLNVSKWVAILVEYEDK
jgi:hypothetical protein